MRWPWRYKGQPVDREGKELAKRERALSQQREAADMLVEHTGALAAEHRRLITANHFGPNTAKALREGHR